MWATTLVCVAALSVLPGQGGELKLSNSRLIYWYLGAQRQDNKVLPGDVVYVSFDIENFKMDDTGRFQFGQGIEVVDSKNKVWFKQDPRNQELVLSLGATTLPFTAAYPTRTDQPPGEYVLKVTLIDRGTKPPATQVLQTKFEILPPVFGIAELKMSSDLRGEIMVPTTGVVGQFYYLNFTVANFERDKAKKQPSLTFEIRMLDEAGKPTVPKPFTGTINKDVPDNYKHYPMQFSLALSRPGKFTLKLKATDEVAKKTAEMSFPITVLPAQ